MKAPATLGTLDARIVTAKQLRKPRKFDSLEDRITKKREKTRLSNIFRDQVWRRDGYHCRVCHTSVRRTLEPEPDQGHVHHLRGRNVAPEDRYNVAQAILVCLVCHLKLHARQVKVPR